VLTSPADPAVRPRAGHRDLARRTVRFSGAAALVVGAVILAVSAAGYLGSAIVGGAVRALVLLLDAGVWLTVALQEGVDWWSIAGRASAVIGQTLFTSRVMSVLIALELVGAAGFYVLQRLLRDEHSGRDSSKEQP
jgi:hypothetical protein